MPSPLALIGSSWEFARKQPALLQVGLWLIFLPVFASNIISSYLDPEGPFALAETLDNEQVLLVILGLVTLWIVTIWGEVCVLLIGKRLLQAKAGRARTSFKAVRLQSHGLIIPLILTGIIRFGMTALWSLLLIIPGIIYSIRTVFYAIAVVCEGLSYRAALARSQEVVQGRFWQTLLVVVMLGVIIFIPVYIFVFFTGDAMPSTLWAMLLFAFAQSILVTVGSVLYTLSLINFYAYLRPAGVQSN